MEHNTYHSNVKIHKKCIQSPFYSNLSYFFRFSWLFDPVNSSKMFLIYVFWWAILTLVIYCLQDNMRKYKRWTIQLIFFLLFIISYSVWSFYKHLNILLLYAMRTVYICILLLYAMRTVYIFGMCLSTLFNNYIEYFDFMRLQRSNIIII